MQKKLGHGLISHSPSLSLHSFIYLFSSSIHLFILLFYTYMIINNENNSSRNNNNHNLLSVCVLFLLLFILPSASSFFCSFSVCPSLSLHCPLSVSSLSLSPPSPISPFCVFCSISLYLFPSPSCYFPFSLSLSRLTSAPSWQQ